MWPGSDASAENRCVVAPEAVRVRAQQRDARTPGPSWRAVSTVWAAMPEPTSPTVSVVSDRRHIGQIDEELAVAPRELVALCPCAVSSRAAEAWHRRGSSTSDQWRAHASIGRFAAIGTGDRCCGAQQRNVIYDLRFGADGLKRGSSGAPVVHQILGLQDPDLRVWGVRGGT